VCERGLGRQASYGFLDNGNLERHQHSEVEEKRCIPVVQLIAKRLMHVYNCGL
jgi:hypothetical protein